MRLVHLAKTALSLLILLLLSSACSLATSLQGVLTPVPGIRTPPPGLVTSFPVIRTPAPTALKSDWYSVYFTDPGSPLSTYYRGGIDEELAGAIDKARQSVDVAIYDLNLWSIRDALLNAHRRGVSVRVVTESDNTDEQEVQELKDAGITVLGDRREGLMHDKFTILDRMEVWTGSMNYTTGGAYRDNNNLVRLRSSRLAEDYRLEFEQMFVDDRFGARKNPITPSPAITVDGSLVEIYFSPEDGVLSHLLETVGAARQSIYFLAYSFTSDPLAEALIERAEAGLSVKGVFDRDQYYSNEGTEFDTLLNAGLDVRLDGNPRLMHHKVIIIDETIVVTGSYNFSNNAENSNDENTLIIHNQAIAAAYLAEFQRIFDISQR